MCSIFRIRGWQVANLVEVDLEQLQHELRHLPINVFDVSIRNALLEKSRAFCDQNVAETNTFDELHRDVRTQSQWIVLGKAPGVNFGDWNRCLFPDEMNGFQFHGHFLICIFRDDAACTGQAEEPDRRVTKDEPLTQIVRPVEKATKELAMELLGVKTRDPVAEAAVLAHFLDFVDPCCLFGHMKKIERFVIIHGGPRAADEQGDRSRVQG